MTTRFVGRLGIDVFGTALRAALSAEGVELAGVVDDPGTPSGIALVTVEDAGENTIVVIPGANGTVGDVDLRRLELALDDTRVLLLQLEIPLPAVVAAAQLARARGVTVILDPAPAHPLPDELLALVDILTPNEAEAAALTGFPITTDEDAARAAFVLHARGVRHVVIKRGRRGALATTADGLVALPAVPVVAVDTVAAGDAFNGGLAVGLAEGRPLGEALRWGLAAGACAVTRHGAQAAMPTRAELLALLAQPVGRPGMESRA
jgi:ribokinase